MAPEILKDYCDSLLKSQYIAFKRSKEELIYKLEVSLISSGCLEVPILERLNILSWYIKEKHAQHIRFEYEHDILRCFFCASFVNIKPELLNTLEGILEYWFENDFKNCLSCFMNGITCIHIALDRLPILKRSGQNYMSASYHGLRSRNY